MDISVCHFSGHCSVLNLLWRWYKDHSYQLVAEFLLSFQCDTLLTQRRFADEQAVDIFVAVDGGAAVHRDVPISRHDDLVIDVEEFC